MYTLRRISSRGIEMNFNLGDSYTVIRKEDSPDHFELEYKALGLTDEKVFALVSKEGGDAIYPLYLNQGNYIVGPDGKTLDNIKPRG